MSLLKIYNHKSMMFFDESDFRCEESVSRLYMSNQSLYSHLPTLVLKRIILTFDNIALALKRIIDNSIPDGESEFPGSSAQVESKHSSAVMLPEGSKKQSDSRAI